MGIEDYKRLLRNGFCDSGHEVYLDQLSREESERWREQVAEPWFASMRGQAERDGLKVYTHVGYGWHPALPEGLSARLLSPDGTEFDMEFGNGGSFRRDRYEQAMLAGWGETLTRARARAGVKPPSWPATRDPDEPAPAWTLRLLRSLLRRRR